MRALSRLETEHGIVGGEFDCPGASVALSGCSPAGQ
jgi:hypothetical protein